MRGQPGSILYLWCFNKFPINHNVHIGIQLLMNSFYYFWMAMACIGYADATNQINIYFAGSIKQLTAFSFYYLKCEGRC